MKKLFICLAVTLSSLCLFAQAPQKMSYQCVIRNAGGALVTNQSVGIKISIVRGTPTGTLVFQEIYNPNPQSNANGLVSLEIGGGVPITGTFSSIDWASGPYFLKTETDPSGGTNYTISGTSQLLSVPYALHAKTVEAGDNWGNQTVQTDASLWGNGTSGTQLMVADNGITSVKIANGTVLTDDLGYGSVNNSKILDGTITTADMSNDIIISSKIVDGTIAANDLGNNTIISDKIANGAVTGGKIADGTITNLDIADNGITVSKLSSSGATMNQVIMYTGTDVAWGGIPGVVLRTSLINVANNGIASFSTTYTKVSDLGTFSKVEANSIVEAVFEGRIGAATLTGTGAHFELRVDGSPPSLGRARATMRAGDTGFEGVPVSITGIFTGLATGSHTLSIWVRTTSGSGTQAAVDPGGFGDDHIIVKEYR